MLDNEENPTSEQPPTAQARSDGGSAAPKKAVRKTPAKRAPRKSTSADGAIPTGAIEPGASEATATEHAASEAAPTEPAAGSSSGAKAAGTKVAAVKARSARTGRKVVANEAAGGLGADAPAEAEAAPDGGTSVAGASAADTGAERPKKAARPRKAAPKKVAPATIADPSANDSGSGEAPAVTAPATIDNGGSHAQPGAAEPAVPPKRTPRKRASKAASIAVATPQAGSEVPAGDVPAADLRATDVPAAEVAAAEVAAVVAPAAPSIVFQPPSDSAPPQRRRRSSAKATASLAEAAAAQPGLVDDSENHTGAHTGAHASGGAGAPASPTNAVEDAADPDAPESDSSDTGADDESGEGGNGRRRRRRGRRGRGSRTGDNQNDSVDKTSEDSVAEAALLDSIENDDDAEDEVDHAEEVAEAALSASARRRRRRRRSSGSDDAAGSDTGADDDPPNTVVHVREARSSGGGRGSEADSDGVRGVKGSTRLEAKRQRRRDNRDSGRRRAPILTEAEFLARREAVDRVMAVRQTGDRTQIAVLEDDILVEHYVTRASASSAVGNVYLGRVQNVLPSMEAAFIDIGRGRNGVLYAGEVNWDAAGLEGKSRAIENALSSGDMVLVQVTKDPIGHKGARLTSQISLPGRFVVYVPGGGMTGISRKLPDVERTRLKAILKKVVPEDAGVIVRTAAEGASEADLVSDVERLKAQWDSIAKKSEKSSDSPSLVYGEPDLAIRVVRDVFNDDFKKLVVAGSDSYATISDYVSDVAPDLADRISLHTAESDLFHDLRVDEQLTKALDRKVYLPSGGSLVIDRTEAMVVIDVNTGKYTGSGGNLEQTVTRNNLEAAEEIVRQLRLRDVGGIIVIDFIDMVLESNRDLVLRRLTECLGRDRTKHQVAEVTSLGLVQMTRKRVGEGLLEAFSEPCEHCKGRGVIVHTDPVEGRPGNAVAMTSLEEEPRGRGKRGRKAKAGPGAEVPDAAAQAVEAEKRRAAASAIAAIAAATSHHDETGADLQSSADLEPSADQLDRVVPAAVAESGATPDLATEPSEPVSKPTSVPAAVATSAAGESAPPAGTAAANGRPRRRRAASRPAG
ncbi:MAG: ribonuclease, partial [Pseudonocardiales bacterium]|nr:ribonuclease [Pseudonocardiales bacterium]